MCPQSDVTSIGSGRERPSTDERNFAQMGPFKDDAGPMTAGSGAGGELLCLTNAHADAALSVRASPRINSGTPNWTASGENEVEPDRAPQSTANGNANYADLRGETVGPGFAESEANSCQPMHDEPDAESSVPEQPRLRISVGEPRDR